MNIFFDHQIFCHEFGGISRYFTELISALMKRKDIEVTLPVFFTNNHYLTEQEFIPYKKYFPTLHFRGKYNLLKKLNNFITQQALNTSKHDLIHTTYYDPTLFTKLGPEPMVCTIHDMTPELFPEYFHDAESLIKNKKKYIDKAAAIITVSNNTKKDLFKFYGNEIQGKKIVVIHQGLRATAPVSTREYSIGLPDEFFLFVGNRTGYKNFNRMLKAFRLFIKNFPNIYLICAGGGPMNAGELKILQELNLKNQVLHLFPSDIELNYLYRKALALIYPSYNEGFGFPILEAFENHCTVLLSQTSCFPEVAGGAGIYFDPYQTDSILEVMLDFYRKREEYKPKYKKLGQERINEFQIQTMVDKTINVYKKILE